MAGTADGRADDPAVPDAAESLRRLETLLMGGERLDGVTLTDVDRVIALLRRTIVTRLAV